MVHRIDPDSHGVDGRMMFEIIPTEMRFPSVITILMFAIATAMATPILFFIGRRLSNVEKIVTARCIDIEKLAKVYDNLEKMVKEFKDDNQRTVGWIREENAARDERMAKDIAEIRKKLYKGG